MKQCPHNKPEYCLACYAEDLRNLIEEVPAAWEQSSEEEFAQHLNELEMALETANIRLKNAKANNPQ